MRDALPWPPSGRADTVRRKHSSLRQNALSSHADGGQEEDFDGSNQCVDAAIRSLDGCPVTGSRQRASCGATGHHLRPGHGCGRRDGSRGGNRGGRRPGAAGNRRRWRVQRVGTRRDLLVDHHPDRIRNHPPGWRRRRSRLDHGGRDSGPLPGPDPQPDRGHGVATPGEGARCPGVGILGVVGRNRSHHRDDPRRPRPDAARARHHPDQPHGQERRLARLQQRLFGNAADDHRQPLRAHSVPAIQLLRPDLDDRPGHRPHRGLPRARLRAVRAERRRGRDAHHHRVPHRPSRNLRLARRWRAVHLHRPVPLRPCRFGSLRDQALRSVHARERLRVSGSDRGRGVHGARRESEDRRSRLRLRALRVRCPRRRSQRGRSRLRPERRDEPHEQRDRAHRHRSRAGQELGLSLRPGPFLQGQALRPGLLQHQRRGRHLPAADRPAHRGQVVRDVGAGAARLRSGRAPELHLRRRPDQHQSAHRRHDSGPERGRRQLPGSGRLSPFGDCAVQPVRSGGRGTRGRSQPPDEDEHLPAGGAGAQAG